MTLRTTAVLIAVLMVVGAIGVTWLVGEAPAPSNAVVERESPADEGRMPALAPPMEAAVLFTDDDGSVGTDEPPGIGNLVIALHDGARFPLTDEQVRLRPVGREAGEVIALTDHQGEAAFESLVEGEYLYTVAAIGRPQPVTSGAASWKTWRPDTPARPRRSKAGNCRTTTGTRCSTATSRKPASVILICRRTEDASVRCITGH